jgi:hypothetical protein
MLTLKNKGNLRTRKYVANISITMVELCQCFSDIYKHVKLK